MRAGPELLAGGPLALVSSLVAEAGVQRVSIPDLKGLLQVIEMDGHELIGYELWCAG